MSGIGLLLNPRAKRHARDPELATRLVALLGDRGIARSPATLEELSQVAEEFQSKGINLVAVAGGDGTNHLTISQLVQAYPEDKLPYFGMLRVGTMNTVANSFGVPRKKPEALLAAYLRVHEQRALKPMRFIEPNLLQVDNHYGFIFGTGAIYGFISAYNRRPDRSAGWAAQVLARAIASAAVDGPTIREVAQRWDGEVRFTDGSAFPLREYLSIGASTCGQIGLGFKPFYRSGEVSDRFHLLGIYTTPWGFISGLPQVWRGRSLGGHKTYEKLTREATLISRDGTVRYTLDGDVYKHPGPLRIASGPRLRIVIP